MAKCWPSTAPVSPHGTASTGPVSVLGRGGSYLGSVHQPPRVQQPEAVLMAVAEARPVGVPLGVTVLVLQ